MSKPTLKTLTDRLDNAARYIKGLEERIVALEEQADKTRKQLWYLQKVAKGEFEPTKPRQVTETQAQAEEDPDDHTVPEIRTPHPHCPSLEHPEHPQASGGQG